MVAASETLVGEHQEVVQILVNLISPNPYQPRKRFNEEKIDELGQSIREQGGLIQPVVVRPLDGGAYELIVGERRLRACKKVHIEIIPAIIRNISAAESRELVLIENLQREDLTPIEEARAFAGLVEQYDGSYANVAERVGKGEPYVRNHVRLLTLPEVIQFMLDERQLNVNQAVALLELEDERDQILAAQKALKLRLTANQIRGMIQGKVRKGIGGERAGSVTLKRVTSNLTQTYDAVSGFDYPKLKDAPKRMALKRQLALMRDKLSDVLKQFGE